jgi:hypothetical protein
MNKPDARQRTLRLAGIAGATLFAAFFALTYHRPEWVEDFAADYLEAKVAGKLDDTIDAMAAPAGDDALSRYAAQLYRQNETQVSGLRRLLKAEVREQLEICIPQIRELSAEQRARIAQWVEDGATLSIGSLTLDNSRLVAIIQSGYLAVVADLQRDIRVFTASNAVAFLLLVLVSFLRPEHTRALFVPGVLLAISTLLCAWLYVFEQNWLLTIIHGDYLGLAYTGWLGVVFLLLCDVWLNRARITIRIVESVASAAGAIVSSMLPS